VYRIATVSFLNSVPLVAWFEKESGSRVVLQQALPSALSRLLNAGLVDVALLPIVEVLRGQSSGLISRSGIACQGSVDSVKLFSRVPMKDVKSILVDRGSRTSVALLRVIYLEQFGFCPDFFETNPDPDSRLQPDQGILVIGDRCFQFDKQCDSTAENGLVGNDLGDLWMQMTGFPFVCAAWAGAVGLRERIGSSGLAELGGLLDVARDHGLAHLDELATQAFEAGKLGCGGDASAQAISYYFRNSLLYIIGDQEWAGMRKFRELCIKHHLVSGDSELIQL
jgi:chorismate dehydratase